MKKLFSLFVLQFLIVLVFAQTPVEEHGALSVSGNKIVNKDGNVVSFSGGSLFWSNTGWGGEKYFTAGVVSWLKEDWNASIMRAAMGVDANGGLISNSENKQKVTTVVDAAIAEGVYVLIDWHSHHAEDFEAEAIQFYEEMATLYGDQPNVIYEIYNEPLQVSWTDVIKPYAESVIAAIRAIDPDNLIIVGTPSWSQDVDVASNNPITTSTNIAYTLHFYAGTHGQYLRDKATTAMNNGIALMVTEWGTVEASGDGAVAVAETEAWRSFMCANNLTNLNWAVNDKVEGASALKPGASVDGNWTDSQLTPSGLLVKDLVKNWDMNCNETTAIENIPDDIIIDFKVFPNPSADILNIYFESKTSENFSVEMINPKGQIIFSDEVKNFKNEYQKYIDTKSLANGIYFIVIKNKNGVSTKQVNLN